MKWTAQRCITKNGNSYSFAIPRIFLMKMRLMRGDLVEMTFDDDTLALHVRSAEPTQQRSLNPRPARGVRELTR
jgi:antitoxin component of MazEF toxin-antitoxin module